MKKLTIKERAAYAKFHYWEKYTWLTLNVRLWHWLNVKN